MTKFSWTGQRTFYTLCLQNLSGKGDNQTAVKVAKNKNMKKDSDHDLNFERHSFW